MGLDEKDTVPRPDGPVRVQELKDVPTEGSALVEGFEWVTMDLTDDTQVCAAVSAL